MNIFDLINVATEEVDKSSNKETEVVVYSKIGEMEGLKLADGIEHHVQLETTFANGTRSRVRKVTKEEGSKFYFTYKVKLHEVNDAVGTVNEFTVETDEAFFENFRNVAERELVKTRYIFNSSKVNLLTTESKTIEHPNVKYEVDVYTKEDGSISEWCKIDLEIDTILQTLEENHPGSEGVKFTVKVKHLPFKPYESILTLTATDEQKLKMQDIWKEFTRAVKKP